MISGGQMDTLNSTTQVASEHKTRGRVKKFLFRSASSIVVIAILAQVTYTYSGSNQWEKLWERNGVTVYSMKSPGSNFKKFKAIWRVHTTLSKFVMFARYEDDPTIGYDMKDIEIQSDKLIWSTWKQEFPSPLKKREFVVKNEFSQDPRTKELLFTVTADPDKIPPNDCCIRLQTMTNSWRLTPLKNGETEIEWFVDMDLGGFLPYFVQNAEQPDGMFYFASKVQSYLDQEKYKNARVDWVEEAQP
jgi:hypothetical protein